MRKILLHICCAPCATFVNQWLVDHDFKVTGFFYNPNIKPNEEYQKREDALKMYASSANLETIFVDNDDAEKFERTLDLDRCFNCYKERLYQAASYAKRQGYDAFTTTLLISPYQKHNLIIESGEIVAKKFGIEFFYEDFRSGYYESRRLARTMNLYRQKYCGCEESYNEQVTSAS